MNRTDRLYALVEELRACAPRRVSARELAARYEVSARTIERDICALQQAGVPIFADVGRGGGYTLDKSRTLPPLNFSPAEAVAVAITLARATGSPYTRSARTALHKIVTAMSAADSASARELADRIRFLGPADGDDPASAVPSVPSVLEEAIVTRRVVRLTYVDREGAETERDVEPVTFTASANGWYLTAWCRMRGGCRIFRTDRVRRAVLLEETAPERAPDAMHKDAPRDFVARPLEFV
ncbi:helix-turn-helix transcriptional regulator [Actinomadura decatromicini]|uniref:YafY family transcriptional regulator n=1 Tax=Actinomadura decatromicini TaxID=2604572 RepID=A0A5D3FEB7_9ACTN|nr:YafY family protein [Actinomadura decatromicini]TYK46226.1 YafY family transcriptional regulator [Actinomadura decatromicini]